jgi:salicylate hydroxylase
VSTVSHIIQLLLLASMSPPPSLTILIVGGGIAGLSTAIALRLAGHTVKVLERSALSSEVGAAVMVPPNATRVLRSWGLDFAAARMVRYRAMQVVRADVDPIEVVHEYDQLAVEDAYGAPYVLSHRVDLHEALLALATGGHGAGTPGEVVTNAAVVSYDAHAGTVTLANGARLTADLVVAADGVHSLAQKYVLGEERPAAPSGTTVIRFMIPTKTVKADPRTAGLLAGEDGQFAIYTAAGGGSPRWLVRYPCRKFVRLWAEKPVIGYLEKRRTAFEGSSSTLWRKGTEAGGCLE